MPFMNAFWVSRTNETNRGAYAAIYTMGWSCAQIIAPLFGSAVIQAAGFKALWWLDGIICSLTAYGFWLLGKKLSKK